MKRHAWRLPVLGISVLAMAWPANAQSLSTFESKEKPSQPKLACRDLRALTGFEFSVDSTTTVGESCLVQGLIQPEVRFEVSLPASWNGRIYMFGNGGYAGESLAAQNRASRRDSALAKGFAVAQTNTGHDGTREPLATFATNPQKLADYAYRAVHVTALTAKKLVSAYYGSPTSKSYFDGCSTGGRQGLISAQRFPEDFDGIVVGAPVLDFTGTMSHYATVQQAFAAAPLTREKLTLLAEKVYAKCDPGDGLSDGLILDPTACRFDLAKDLPTCSESSSAGCFTVPELRAVQSVYAAVGSFPGFPVGAEALVPAGGPPGAPTPSGPRSGWDPWIVRFDGQPAIETSFVETFFKHMVTPGTEIDWRTFAPDRDKDKLRTISALLDATDPDLSRFKGRGGKIVMYYGWADPALSALMGVKYYESVREKMGAGATDFFRLFMAPGMFHCAGGVGPNPADPVTPLISWVERGTAPAQLHAVQRRGEQVVRSRPLCPHPQVAKYKGSGSADDAASFSCATP